MSLGFLISGTAEAECAARLRELRALALVYCGAAHPATLALAEAIADPTTAARALAHLDGLPALQRRRLLSAYGALRD
jgi:hypothetical protein